MGQLTTDRKTKAGMAQFKAANHAKILSSHLVTSGEPFTTADCSAYLTKSTGEYVCHGIAASYLKELVDAGKLVSIPAKKGAKAGTIIYSRKPHNLLKRSWRFRTNEYLKIAPMDRLGVPQ